MRTRLPSRVLAAASVIAVCLTGAPSSAAVTDPSWFWEWSDGSRAVARAVAEDRFGTWERVPAVRVASSPRAGGVRVLLQVHDAGRWRTEDSAVTDARGRASLRINPYCSDGAWCTGTSRYRLRAGPATATFTVTFTRRQGLP